MLTGHVTAENEAIVRIQVVGPAGQICPVEAAIDTGYDGFLTLPVSLIHELDLPYVGTARATLGDGNQVRMTLFRAAVLWEEEPCEVLVLASEGGVLLGMALLTGSRVTLDVENNGTVTIESLAQVRSVN